MTIKRFTAALLATGALCGYTLIVAEHNRNAEYERVVLAVAEAYEVDPSEVEEDARLVETDRTTNAVLRRIANCTLEDARAERCFIPCATDEDCMAKNSTTDH